MAATGGGYGGGVHDMVRQAYAQTAQGGAGVLPLDVGDPKKRRELLGYEEGDVTESADLGLGCGNPLIAAKLQAGEVVVDLGSGAGMDCFIAGKQVGKAGQVIGVDMTAEMLARARGNAKKDGIENVSFRLGEIEHLPVGDGVADCVISNCVINLSPDKPQVYREMARVLKPGGRVSISDVLRMGDIPESLQTAQSYSCWIAGASAEDEMREMLSDAGFTDIDIRTKDGAADIIKDWMPGSGAEKVVTSVYVNASKPRGSEPVRDNVRMGTKHQEPVVYTPPACDEQTACGPGAWG